MPFRKIVTNGFGVWLERESMKMLGSFIGKNDKHKHECNNCSLSLFEKILVSKIFGMSIFVYGMKMSEPNNDNLTSAQTETNKFIYGYKPAKIKHKTLIAKHVLGGLKAIDCRIIHQFLALNWLSRL